jgi:hypothetical protein
MGDLPLRPPCPCDFLLEYKDDGKPRRYSKPCHHGWTDPVRDEVPARLLTLNATRDGQERLTGAAAGGMKQKKAPKSRTAKAGSAPSGSAAGEQPADIPPDLFG